MAHRIALVGADGDSVGVPAPGRVSTHRFRLALVAVLVAALLVGAAAWKFSGGGNAAIASSSEITATQLEQEYGVRIDVVGLIAGGGLVELKFQVTDADKATALFGEVADMPLLAVEGSSAVLQSAKGMKHSLTLLDGASYFFLYTNVGDAVHDGSQVAFVVNGVRLAHLTVLR